MKTNIKILILQFFIVLLINPIISSAKDYDYYVDESVKENGDGSEEEPFESIEDAIKKADKGETIYIKDGSYKENITLPNSVSLVGESQGGVEISGEVTMSDKTSLKNLTVVNGTTTITVKEDADVQIESCTIANFLKIGINTLPGGGEMKLTNSKIINSSGKGIYIQRGKKIQISGNIIANNGEEGIDIRSKVDGSITSNVIEDNGESGIELIVGSADINIKNNKIKDNGSSGIAFQFYEDFDKDGDINATGNKITKNKKYGIDCNRPQGGKTGGGYWSDSIDLSSNEIQSNKEEAINSYCDLIEAVDEDEEKDNKIEEGGFEEEKKSTPTSNVEAVAQIEIKTPLNQAEKQEIEKEMQTEKEQTDFNIENIKNLLKQVNKNNLETQDEIRLLMEKSSISYFLSGIDESRVNDLLNSIDEREKKLHESEKLVSQTHFETEDELVLQNVIDEEKSNIEKQREFINKKKNKFSLIGWIKENKYISGSIGLLIIGLISTTIVLFRKEKKKKFKEDQISIYN